jgi:hypothetical protein
LKPLQRLFTAALTTAFVVTASVAYADTGSPTADSSGTPNPSGSATPTTSPSPASPTPTSPSPASPTPTSPSPVSPTPTSPSPVSAAPPTSTAAATTARAEPKGENRAQRNVPPPTVTLTITAEGTPQPGKFFEDIGYYAIKGSVTNKPAASSVEIYWYNTAKKQWQRSEVAATTAAGSYAVKQRVGHAAIIAFRATLGGSPSQSGVIMSNQVLVSVANSYVTENRPVTSIDSLKNPVVSGFVYPARPGVKIHIQVQRSDKIFRAATGATTDAAGRFRAAFAYGNGQLASYSVRSVYPAANRPRWEISSPYSIKRVKALDAVITSTSAADVAKTYRQGCPVGPSKLRTIRMNYFGFDMAMHRGVLIVRSTLTGRVIRGFLEALDAGFPIAKMKNPNDYGGNDPKQMAADNTSAFNCRKVVGNPYAQSPHSYGIAIDVNTVQNPYRDRNGKWWPANGKSYIDRTPRRFGMLTYHSHLTTQLRKEGFFWGGLWSPGKDYQHFEYDR